MPKSVRSFDRMIIPAPCGADWDSMAGNDHVPLFEHCSLQVTNLSNMTRQDAIRLIARSEGRVCVRFVKRADGSVLTKHAPKKLHHISRRVSRIAAGAFTATLSFANASAQTSSPPPVQARVQRALSPVETGSTLYGIVGDPHGAVVSGATVTLTDLKGGSLFTFTTGDDGAYKFALLPGGVYSLTAHANSFSPATVEKIELAGGGERAINVALKLPEIVVETEIIALPFTNKFQIDGSGGAIAFIEPVEPLVRAAFKEDLEAVKALAFATLDLNARDKYTRMTALEEAAENGNLEIVRTLLLAGANANAKNESGRTALMYLRRERHRRSGARIDRRRRKS